MRKLEFEEIPSEQIKQIFCSVDRKGTTALPQEVVDKVIEFYSSDKFSWQASGRKDVLSSEDPIAGKRSKIAKRYLVLTIAKLYKFYCNMLTRSRNFLCGR